MAMALVLVMEMAMVMVIDDFDDQVNLASWRGDGYGCGS